MRLYLRLAQFDRAAALADSILALPIPAYASDDQRDATIELLMALSALRGRGLNAIDLELTTSGADIVSLRGGGEISLPRAFVSDYVRLRVYSELGGPRDSIVAMSNRLSEQLPPFLPDKQVGALLTDILLRPLMLAAPVTGPELVGRLGPTSEPFALALKALNQGDRRSAQRWADSLHDLHAVSPAAEITADAVLLEAWLSAVLGDNVTAIRKLDNALKGLSAAVPSVMRHRFLAASLVRAMALRAELAAYTGKPDVAKYWSNAVFQLWGRGDVVTAATLNNLRRFR